MNIKILLTLWLGAMTTVGSFASEGKVDSGLDIATLVVTYDYITLDTAYSKRPRRFAYVLQHGGRYDRFFDKRQYEKENDDGGEESFVLPSSLGVIIDRKSNTAETRNAVATTNIMYTEPIPEMEWKIVADSAKNICGHSCKLATTTWRGREWKAWFAPDINVSAGPWKFHGLPGLILEMDDTTGAVHWGATEIKAEKRSMYSPSGEFTPVSREEYNSTLRFYGTDMLGYLNSIGLEPKVNGVSGVSKKMRTHYAPPELE